MDNAMPLLERPDRSPRACIDPDHIYGLRDVSINTTSQSRFVGVMKNREWFSRRHNRNLLWNCSDEIGICMVIAWDRK